MLIKSGRDREALDEITDLERDSARYSDETRARLARLRGVAHQEASSISREGNG